MPGTNKLRVMLMRIEVRVFSGLEKYLPGVAFGQAFSVELPEGSTPRDLLSRLGIPEEQVFTVLKNGRHLSWDGILQDGDRIGLFPPVGGG
ncbi:MAG: MoaD/ThiS family protein [Bacillota bacterium]|uniref:MoaD/ThiS family protein n=1 Tax=Desulfurispora thermophila TaxID=265470 RepID=UPI0034A46A07